MVNNRRIKWALAVCVCALGCWLVWWASAPWFYISAIEDCRQGGDEYPQWAENALVRMGPRAVGPILARLRAHGVFNRGTCLLPAVLKRIGEPAHRALLEATDHEANPAARIGYVYTLQEAFHDNSRLPLWIDYALNRKKSDVYLTDTIACTYRDAPILSDGSGGISPEFLAWYRKKRRAEHP